MISTLVIGGGIGGLSLARELALRHLPVTFLEKAPQLDPVCAGIIMNPNAMRVLERNGLAEAVRVDSWPYLLRETCDQSGRSLAMRDYRPLYEAGKLSVGALVHRAHLLDVLYRSLPWGGALQRRRQEHRRPARLREGPNRARRGPEGGSSGGRGRHPFPGAAPALRRDPAALHGVPIAPADCR